MKNEETIVNFDLSALTLTELISLYENVTGFLDFLSLQKIEEVGKEGDKNE